jgi:pantothenate synthetase
MIIDYNSIKKLFNYILDNEYEIILDKNYNNIMYIKHNNGEIKCKYVLIFSTINEENNKILWSYENEYIDRKTREISKILKEKIKEEKTKLNDKFLIKMINKIISSNIIIKYEEEEIIPLWIIRNKDKISIQYYMIIDIIYL